MYVRAALASLLVSMLVLGGVVSYLATYDESVGLDSFQTQAEFSSYLRALQRAASNIRGGSQWELARPFSDLPSAAETQGAEGGFSGTNVQVAGVDEADIVKTDGEFLYLAAGEEVVLVRAHPAASMAVVSRIRVAEFVGDSNGGIGILGLFLHEETLVVISSSWSVGGDVRILPATDVLMPISESRTVVSLFSVADPSDPTLHRVLEFTGSHQASRLKGGVVYLVLHQALWIQEDETSYPTICSDGQCAPYEADRIYYDKEAPEAGSLTNVVAIDLETEEVGYLSVLTGFASTVYMSLDNLYVTFAKWGRGEAFPRSGLMSTQTGFTSIYRIAVDGTDLSPAAGGNINGWLLNQFSLDEDRGYLRAATTTWGGTPENAVYVLDLELEVVGALEGLAPGESIYSARFVGEFGYLVTFQKVDPFFVLDLSDPTRPEVLGYLKIPGFSEYLHPMDETHILGVGKDAIEDPSGEFAWFQGLKLSLFDVTDFRAPKEVAKFLIGDRGSSSPVLYDHKAFLYVEKDGLVVLPVDLLETVAVAEGNGSAVPPWRYGSEPWQGALVLSVDPVSGFQVEASITHVPPDEAQCSYAWGPYAVSRSLYIGAYLYTISPTVLKAHALDGFAEASSLVYGESSGYGGC